MSALGTTSPHAVDGTFGGRQRKLFVMLTLTGHRDGNDQNRELEFK
jgi:hypothetical protein